MTDFFHYLMAGGLWGFMIIGGPILLGLTIAFGVAANRNRTRREREMTDRGTRKIYEEVDREKKAEGPNSR